MIKRVICSFFIIIIILTAVILPASAYIPTSFDITAEGALLASIDTGDVIFSKNADEKLFPASLTKLMTALLLYENTSDLDGEIITVSDNALKILQGTDSSVGGLKEGEQLTARQMLYVLLLSSANDGANAIAEHVAGSIDNFVVLMNNRAAELGMTCTHYANAHGLHDPEHYTTVNDMYKLVTKFLSIGVLKDVCYTKKYTLDATNKNSKRSFTTTNLLLLNDGQKSSYEKYKNQAYYYEFANGVKTGYTDHAGRCLISTASKNGYNYLCILMKCPVYNDKNQKIRAEFGDAKALYNWAFSDFVYKNVLNSGEIIGEVPIDLAWDQDYIAACTSENLTSIVPKVADSSTIITDIRWYKDSYNAPISKGDVLGECDVIYAGEVLGTVTLVASQDVERSTVMYVYHGIKVFFSSVFSSPVFLVILAVVILILIAFIAICVAINSPKHRKRRY